ncbi:MAG: tetratricopeptide repeat protein, partial [Bryobacteraceae bacterium]
MISAVAGLIAGLWAADVFLARVQDRELSGQARSDYAGGVRLLAENRPAEAADALRKAYDLDRTNSSYELRLAEALLADGKLDEAAGSLADVLERSPNNGEANLLEARLIASEGKFDEAVSYYHRAIYGIWREDPQARTLAA